MMFNLDSVQASWNVWLDHSVKKYRQNGEDGIIGRQSLTVKMAKNEFEAFQVLIYANGQKLSDVDVSVSDFIKGDRRVDDISIYREHYIRCKKKSRVDYKTGSYPDALLPKVDRYYNEKRTTFPFDIPADTVQGVWVDIGTSAVTFPGTYLATVTITAHGMKAVQLPVTLHIWDFTLPSTASYPALYIAHASTITYGHGLGQNINSGVAIELIKTYNKSFLTHRTVSWIRGDGYSYRYKWDSSKKKLTILDWNPWEKFYADFIEGTAITSGPYTGARFPLVNIHRVEWVDVNNKIAVEDKQTAARQYLQQIYDHFQERGWDPYHNLYVNVADEPKCNNLKKFRGKSRSMCDIVKLQAQDAIAVDTDGAGPWKNVYVHTHKTRQGITDFEKYGFYSPNFSSLACPDRDHNCRKSKPKTPRKKYRDYPADRLWPYLSCNNHGCQITGNKNYSGQIDLSIDAPAGYNRLISYLLWKYEGTGTLFWSVDSNYREGTGDPYFSSWIFGANGDGTLLYPGITTRSGRVWSGGKGQHTPALGGSHDIPIASMRWKYIRDWQEDLEYMEMARKKAGKSAVDHLVDTVFTKTDSKFAYWNLKIDPTVLLSTREKIAGLILGKNSTRGN